MTFSMIRSIVLGTISALLVLTALPAAAENRLALVIGQSAYRAVTPLPNPANDAKAMSQMLSDAGFEVLSASDLSQTEMREKAGEFAAKIAEKGPDTIALIFYAGHGLQVDGENFLVPVDLDPKREADIPLQAVRLNDIMNTLTSVPSRMRIVLLDACRNNPFPAINKTVGHGLAIVDAKVAAPGTFLSFSTSPGAEAEDGTGTDSPYTTALLSVGRQPGLSIEEAFKRVRLEVNKMTDGRQTPWDSSSLTDGFQFFPGTAESGAAPAAVSQSKRTVAEWRRELKGKTAEQAHELIVGDGSDQAYEAFIGLYAGSPLDLEARQWLDRHRRMAAWNRAVLANTAAGYRAFLADYPDSDLTPTARKLEERLRNRPDNPAAAVAAATPGPTCPCSAPPREPKKKAETRPKKKQAKRNVDAPVRRSSHRPTRYVDDVPPPPPPSVVPLPIPSIGIIGGFGGGGFGRGGYGGSGRGGGMGGTTGRY